jgi:hypothetical protein
LFLFFYRKRNHDIDIQLSPKGVSMIKITFRKDISTERYVAITWQYVEKIDITEKPDYGNDTIISTFSSDEVPSPFYQSPTQYYLDVEDHKLRRSLAAFSFRSDEELGVVIVDWENITNRPAQYPPTAHHHSFLDIDDTSSYIVTPGQFNEHVSDKDNPHEVTITQIGAAAANHTHTLKALGAAATNHNHDTVYSKLTHDHDSVYSKLTHDHDEVYAKTNHNHNTVYSKIDHTHTPEEVGAAAEDHTHTEASLNINKENFNYDERYARLEHTHTAADLNLDADSFNFDNRYALINHNHDEAYAALDHTHTASSIGAATATHTHTYSDVTGVAAADHNHDAVYAPKSHSHTLSEISDYEKIPVYVGATEDAVGITGTVPAAGIGDRNKFLRGDGTYGQDDTKADLSGATFTGGVFEIPVTVSPSQNVTITVSNGNTQVITINEATTFSFSGTPENTACCFSLALTNGDSYTVTWPENIKWHNGTSPTLAHISILTFITVDGGTTWYGVLSIAAL